MTQKPLSKAELWKLGQAIAETAKPTASPRMRVFFEDNKVASSDGHVLVGDFGTPHKAIRIAGGDDDNRCFYIRSKLLDDGNSIAGLRLARTLPVRWETRGSFTATHPYKRGYDPHVRVGFWTPGFPTTAWKGTSLGFKRIRGKSGSAWGDFANTKISVVVGLDADDAITCVIADGELDPAWFAAGRTAIRPPTRAEAAKVATAARRAVAGDAAIERGEPVRAAPATASDLRAIAAAIAAGPAAKRTKITKRFSLAWDAVAPVPVDGKLAFGDPDGASFDLAAGRTEPKPAFRLYDADAEDDLAWGRLTLGIRLGPGKAMTWKLHTSIGVDSGRYGIWSPDRSAQILQATAEGDGGFPSLLGLDARKRPVAFLLGESLDPAVFGARPRR